MYLLTSTNLIKISNWTGSDRVTVVFLGCLSMVFLVFPDFFHFTITELETLKALEIVLYICHDLYIAPAKWSSTETSLDFVAWLLANGSFIHLNLNVQQDEVCKMYKGLNTNDAFWLG